MIVPNFVISSWVTFSVGTLCAIFIVHTDGEGASYQALFGHSHMPSTQIIGFDKTSRGKWTSYVSGLCLAIFTLPVKVYARGTHHGLRTY